MSPLPCPFCGAEPVIRADGPDDATPFRVRCSHVHCPAAGEPRGAADPETAITSWNRRTSPKSERAPAVADVIGFTKKSLLRGEMVSLTLDRTGVFTSDELEFSRYSVPLARKEA